MRNPSCTIFLKAWTAGTLAYCAAISHEDPFRDMANGGMNMQNMMGKIMEMQKKMNQAQDELADKEVTAEAGGGMVKVTANGAQKITGIEIDPEAIDPDDLELLEDLIIAGVNKALDEASEMAQGEMQKSMGGMLPPGMDLSQLGL
jgi:nucleoid-associated protein EbfC